MERRDFLKILGLAPVAVATTAVAPEPKEPVLVSSSQFRVGPDDELVYTSETYRLYNGSLKRLTAEKKS